MDEPEVYWTLQIRGRGETKARDYIKPVPVDLFSGPPEPHRFLVRYKAVMQAMSELMAGAEAIEITRVPPLKQTTKKQPENEPETPTQD